MARELRIPLSRDRVLQAAVELADRSGVEAVTMRGLGDELGFEAMSLYRHVANKDDLLDGMLDLVLAEWQLPDADTDWADAVKASARSVHDGLRRHPWAARLLTAGGRFRPARSLGLRRFARPRARSRWSWAATGAADSAIAANSAAGVSRLMILIPDSRPWSRQGPCHPLCGYFLDSSWVPTPAVLSRGRFP